MHLLRQLPGQPTLSKDFCEEKLANFLNDVQMGYMQKVQYHNDLHGADVA
jgi:hypothetical protein